MLQFLNGCHFRTCDRQIDRDAFDCATAAQEDNNNEIENMNQPQLEIYKKRVEGMSKTNSQLRRDLKKTVRR